MAAVVRRTQPKRKKATPLPRKPRTGILAAPTESYQWFAEYLRTDVEKKEIAGVIRNYIKENYKGEERTLLLNAPDYYYTSEYGVAATIQWKSLGYPWPARWDGNKKIQSYIDRTRAAALKKLLDKQEDSDTPKIAQRSPMEVVKERTTDFIANIEEVLDLFYKGGYVDIENYSVYNEMIKADLNSFSAKHVLDYYIPLQKEVEELVNEKTIDLVEGYRHMPVAERRRYLTLVQKIVDDTKRYLLSKKAKRAPSKPKVKTADKQITKIVYAKDSAEFKLTSINPMQIIGAKRLFTFNVKERIITEYVTRSSKGFEMKGTTLQLFDEEQSRSIRLRKPDESLTIFLTKPKTHIHKHWDTLTTKATKPTGRINKDTIILRVMDA